MSYVIREGYYDGNEFEIELLLETGFISFSSASNFLGDYPGLVDMAAQKTGKEVKQLESKGFTSGFTAASWYGNAFWMETLHDKHYRFHCNDHFMDDDFDDLVFDVMVEYSPENIMTL